MFICPKCENKLSNNVCDKCSYEIPYINGVYHYTDAENINIKNEGNKYIGYDEINIHFDPSLIYWKDHYGIYEASAKDIVEKRGQNIVVLDIGCGLGTAIIPFAKFKATAIGIDISSAMLEYAYKRSKEKYNNLYLCKMNAYKIMLADSSVDVIVENAMIHLVDNPEQVYKEMYRVLKPNGVLIRFTSHSLTISEDQKELSNRCYSSFKDISNFYLESLNQLGYVPLDFNNYSKIIEEKYFHTNNLVELNPILDYKEEFTEYMKFRIHRLEHKAHSYLQHVPNEVHNLAWKLTDDYAKVKYGINYKNMPNYSLYKAAYNIFLKNSNK